MLNSAPTKGKKQSKGGSMEDKELELYEHAFEVEAPKGAITVEPQGLRVVPMVGTVDSGVIHAPIGASLSEIYSRTIDAYSAAGMMGKPLPWVVHVDTVGSRKASYYTEHRAGRSFSYRRRMKATSKAVTIAGKPAVQRKPAQYVREYRALVPGWVIERVA